MVTKIETYLEKLKSKPIASYALTELSEKIDEIHELYNETTDKQTKKVLQGVYYKIIQHYNQRAGKKIYSQGL
jgi:hypothetical protein